MSQNLNLFAAWSVFLSRYSGDPGVDALISEREYDDLLPEAIGTAIVRAGLLDAVLAALRTEAARIEGKREGTP